MDLTLAAFSLFTYFTSHQPQSWFISDSDYRTIFEVLDFIDIISLISNHSYNNNLSLEHKKFVRSKFISFLSCISLKYQLRNIKQLVDFIRPIFSHKWKNKNPSFFNRRQKMNATKIIIRFTRKDHRTKHRSLRI